MAKWTVTILRPTQRYLERQRILDALQAMQDEPKPPPGKQFKGRPERSLRVGERRVLFVVDHDAKAFIITAIGSRGDIYKG